MSCGPTDMRREEEHKAVGMVERRCGNCVYNGTLYNCDECCENWYVDYSDFTPTRHAINLKLEELRTQEKEDGESKENLMDEAIKYFDVIAIPPLFMDPAYPGRIERIANKCQHYQDIADFLKSVKSERKEMIQAFKDIVNCVTLDNILEDSKRDIKEIAQNAIKKAEGK